MTFEADHAARTWLRGVVCLFFSIGHQVEVPACFYGVRVPQPTSKFLEHQGSDLVHLTFFFFFSRRTGCQRHSIPKFLRIVFLTTRAMVIL